MTPEHFLALKRKEKISFDPALWNSGLAPKMAHTSQQLCFFSKYQKGWKIISRTTVSASSSCGTIFSAFDALLESSQQDEHLTKTTMLFWLIYGPEDTFEALKSGIFQFWPCLVKFRTGPKNGPYKSTALFLQQVPERMKYYIVIESLIQKIYRMCFIKLSSPS